MSEDVPGLMTARNPNALEIIEIGTQIEATVTACRPSDTTLVEGDALELGKQGSVGAPHVVRHSGPPCRRSSGSPSESSRSIERTAPEEFTLEVPMHQLSDGCADSGQGHRTRCPSASWTSGAVQRATSVGTGETCACERAWRPLQRIRGGFLVMADWVSHNADSVGHGSPPSWFAAVSQVLPSSTWGSQGTACLAAESASTSDRNSRFEK